jgi:hypothetical protein
VTHLGLSKVRFGSLGSHQDVRLVPSSLNFLYEFGAGAPVGINAILLVDKPSWCAGCLPKWKRSAIKWICQDHSKFGGATDYCYLFGVIGLKLDPTLSNLAQSIGHIFDQHPLKPTSTMRELPTNAYTLGSVLRVNDLVSPVAFHTHFARNGWGLRTLNPDKIRIAFRLSQRLRLGATTSAAFPLPLVQGLVGWLGALTSKGHVGGALPLPVRRIIPPPPTSTWFPKISRSLSHAWIDEGTVSDKAVEHDDAKVPIQL